MKTRRDFLKTAALAGSSFAVRDLAHATAPQGAGQNSPRHVDALAISDHDLTRGVGVYPGLRTDYVGPVLVPDTSGRYRNLALFRPAFHSSAYDYNLTAQLITDGIKHTATPEWVETLVNGEVLSKQQREVPLDHFPGNLMPLPGAAPVVEIRRLGGSTSVGIDRVELFVVVPQTARLSSLTFRVSTSEDGHLWQEAGVAHGADAQAPDDYPPDMARGSHIVIRSVPLPQRSQSRYWRVELAQTEKGEGEHGGISWRLGQAAFFSGKERVQIGGPYSFTSAWKSAGEDTEWVYVDLGAACAFDRVTLHWIAKAAEGKVQCSADAIHWTDVHALPGGPATVDDLRLPATRARYVRVLMTRPATGDGYILSEMEIFGRGGIVPVQQAPAQAFADGTLPLAGGGWRLLRASEERGEVLSAPGFDDSQWMIATVPGTTLTSYLNAGAVPDPNFGENQLHISDSYFYADFWFRNEFVTPTQPMRRLDFDGVNWKAEVYLNGGLLGRIDGGFMRASFDLREKLKPGARNALAVRVLRNATPGSVHQKTLESTGKNGGGLGSDNPTYHASAGWDWIPTIRGRNTGIWGAVKLVPGTDVRVVDPCVSCVLPLPQTNLAEVTLRVNVANAGGRAVSGVLRGRLGDVSFEQKVKIAGEALESVVLTPKSHPELRIQNPKLWWPNGYGDPSLHDLQLTFVDDTGRVLDEVRRKVGLRQFTYSEEGGALRMWVNGRRFIARGGNWGFSESMLRFRDREYDIAVRYHRDMNFTMIRNWVGQIGDEAFYDACDRHGIVVWQDFWLANPWDGPIPDDNALFLANARDLVAKIRSHASLGLYCGRNEGDPPAPLETGLRKLLNELHPDLYYIPSSADHSVSGHGPYRTLLSPMYFQTADRKLHSELGAPAIPPIESVRAMMPPPAVWPQGLSWGLHDFTMAGAQGGTEFLSLINDSLGGAETAETWIELAQLLNYDSYRAMFEAQAKYRMGLLLWMSHSCWPSFVWQTYDYYFEPTAAYFGSKKGSEPLHIQWNSYTETLEVVNYNAGDPGALQAELQIFDLQGNAVSKKSYDVRCPEDSVTTVAPMQYPSQLTDVHFLRLTLRQGTQVRSTNFYMRSLREGDLRAIRTLPKAKVTATATVTREQDRWMMQVRVRNASSWPALHVRLKVVGDRTGERILPAMYEDNYLALMPGEERQVRVELQVRDARGEKPTVALSGFNLQQGNTAAPPRPRAR